MNTKSNIIVALAIIAVSAASFISGRFSVEKKAGNMDRGGNMAVEMVENGSGVGTNGEDKGTVGSMPVVSAQASSTSGSEVGENRFVASKNGQKYFPISCGSAKTIKKENAIYFKTMEEAELSGRTQSTQCKY